MKNAIKKTIKRIVSLIKHGAIGTGIAISIMVIMKLLTYVGLSYNIASTIAAFVILIPVISVFIWLFKDCYLEFEGMKNG